MELISPQDNATCESDVVAEEKAGIAATAKAVTGVEGSEVVEATELLAVTV